MSELTVSTSCAADSLTARFHKFRRGHYWAFPGGYPMFAVTSDGAALCGPCVSDPGNPVRWVPAGDPPGHFDGWGIETFAVNYEDKYLHCGHCSGRIESAYRED